jgi:hypothetical protein
MSLLHMLKMFASHSDVAVAQSCNARSRVKELSKMLVRFNYATLDAPSTVKLLITVNSRYLAVHLFLGRKTTTVGPDSPY